MQTFELVPNFIFAL